MKKICVYILLSCSFLLVGCVQDLGTSSYAAGDVGQVNRAVPATVVSMRPVTVSASSGDVGTVVGAGAGAVAGSLIGGSTTAHVLGGIGGAVAGGLAGRAIEKGVGQKKGMEYVLRIAKDKSLVTVTQLQDLQLYVGQKVLIMYGKQTRIVPDYATGGK